MTAPATLPDPYEVPQVHLTRAFSGRPPGSKSLTNRALIMAALTGHQATLLNPLTSEDTEVAREALQTLGAEITAKEDGNWSINGTYVQAPAGAPLTLHLGNAGTAMRFLTATLCARGLPCTLDGTARMRERPMQDLIQALQDLGGDVRSQLGNGCPPIVIGPGGLEGGETTMSGQVSSQFFSALMLAAPWARRDIVIHIKDELLSRPYVEMTAQLLKTRFQVDCSVLPDRIEIRAGAPGTSFQNGDILIEPDASAASYPLALGVLHQQPTSIQDLGRTSLQGDVAFATYLTEMGLLTELCDTQIIYPAAIPLQSARPLTADLREIPDAAMTLVTLLAVVPGHSSLTGLRNLAFKECDRLTALETELGRLGAKVRVREDRDGFEIDGVNPASLRQPADGPLHTYKDHRMAMCLAILGTIVPGGVLIEDPRCVEKTYPNFWQDLQDWIRQGTGG